MFIPYAQHKVTDEEVEAVADAVRDGWIGFGKRCIELEKQLAPFFDRGAGVLVNSGSSANLLAISTLMSPNVPEEVRLRRGDRVIVPICGFPTTLNPILQLGLVPIFVGTDIGSYNLTVSDLEKTKKYNPRAVMFAHALGNPADIDPISYFCDENNLVMIEDCCDAIGAYYNENPVGSFGELATLSMYPAHHFSCGQGGYVTGDRDLVSIARSMRDWGRACTCYGKDSQLENGMCGNRFADWLGLEIDVDHKYVYSEIGYNFGITEMQAAIGLCDLQNAARYYTARRSNFFALYNIFKEFERYFHLPEMSSNKKPSWFCFPLTTKKDKDLTREKVVAHFESNGIQTRPFFAGNILRHPAYRNIGEHVVCADTEIADKITRSTFFIGLHPYIGPEQIEYIGKVTKELIKSR